MRFQRAQWSSKVEQALRAATHDDTLDELRSDVESGRVALWSVDDDTFFTVKILGRDMIVETFAGRDIVGAGREILRTALKNGFTLRLFSRSAAVARKWSSVLQSFDKFECELRVKTYEQI